MNKVTSAKPGKDFDLMELDTIAASDAGAMIEILHPVSKEPTPIRIKVLGKHSEVFRELVKERANKRVSEDFVNSRRGKFGKPRTAEQMEQEALTMLCACTIGWERDITNDKGEVVETKQALLFDGEELSWSVPNGMKVYGRMLWIRKQVDDAIDDLENFIKA